VASVIRTAKLTTIEATDATKPGKIPAALLQKVISRLGEEPGIVR